MKSIRWIYRNLLYFNKTENNKSFYALYGVFLEKEGQILGYIEQSFSMAWSEKYVRLWSRRDAEIYKKKLEKEYKNVFIYRLTRKSPNAKIVADLKKRKSSLANKYDKFLFRNVEFTDKVK
jgi:hypothetical protein